VQTSSKNLVPDSRFRQHAYTQPLFYHSADAVEAAHLNADFERSLGRERGSKQTRKQRTAFVESDIFEIERVNETYALVSCERMVVRYQQDELVAPIDGFLDVGSWNVVCKDTNVGIAASDRSDDVSAESLLEGNLYARVVGQERPNVPREELDNRRRVRPHSDVTTDASGVVAHLICHTIYAFDNLPSVCQQPFTCSS
jgi:hypothetical protein